MSNINTRMFLHTIVKSYVLVILSLGTLQYAAASGPPMETFDIQLQNINRLKNLGQLVRVIPHRVNSAKKLEEVISAGYLSFEMDVIFRDIGINSFFEVGHDDQSATGIELGAFLKVFPVSKFKKIWLDVKSVNENNLPRLRDSLLALEREFAFKEKVIFETSSQTTMLSMISDAGYHVSYYLPTDTIIELLDANKFEELIALSERIAVQINEQHVSAVSFDARLYPFVKKWLEQRLSTKIDYHTWDLAIALDNKNCIEQLQLQDYFRDERIKTILLPFMSEFHL